MLYNACGLQYDKNRSGALEFEELHAVLADLGIMVSPAHHTAGDWDCLYDMTLDDRLTCIVVNSLSWRHCRLPKVFCLNHVQDGVKQTEVDSYVAQQFRQADTDGDGQVTFEDFCEYYEAMSISRARLELRSTMGMEAEREHLSLIIPGMNATHRLTIYYCLPEFTTKNSS